MPARSTTVAAKIPQGHLPSSLEWIELPDDGKRQIKCDLSNITHVPEVDEMGYIATHAVVYTTGRSLNQKFMYELVEPFFWVETLSLLRLACGTDALVVGIEDAEACREKKDRAGRTILAMQMPLKERKLWKKASELQYVELSQIVAISSGPIDKLHGKPTDLDGFIAQWPNFLELSITSVEKIQEYKSHQVHKCLGMTVMAAKARTEVREVAAHPAH